MNIVVLSDRNRALQQAIEHHMAGRLDQAEEIYSRLHRQDPRDAEVLYLMGVLCCDLGIFLVARRFLDAALAIMPVFPEASRQLAIALIGLAGHQADANELDAAESSLQHALGIMPGEAQILRGLGRIALLRGAAAQAQHLLEQALQRGGEHAESLNWLGLAYLQQEQYAAAEQALKRAVALQPGLTQAHGNLGLALYHQGRLAEAQACFEAALAHDPGYAIARINLANTLRILGRYDEARLHLEQVLEQQPESVEARNNLGTVLQDIGQPQQALAQLERAAALAPAAPQVRWNLALTQLLLGELADGWANFEFRWEGCANLRTAYRKPLQRAWQGQPLDGKRLLLWAEQGFGDTLQFIRFAAHAARMGAQVTLEAPAELAALLADAPGVAAVVLPQQEAPYDYHCPLMSLPHRLGLGLDELSATVPYLRADAAKQALWANRLAAYPGKKVGLVWAGHARTQNAELAAIDARRSIALQQLTPLLATDCHFFSLQKGPRSAELAAAALPAHDFSAELADFSDTAALIAALDLVISVDTAVAHLAGAMGKPVWLLNRYDSCWRWLHGRNDSPWYPSLLQFRQTHPGEWSPVIDAVAAQLALFSNS